MLTLISLPIILIVSSFTISMPFLLTFGTVQGIDALMAALQNFNGGVIVISHDERFLTTVSQEVSSQVHLFISRPLTKSQLWVCADGSVYKYKGDVQAYKVCPIVQIDHWQTNATIELDCERAEEDKAMRIYLLIFVHACKSPCGRNHSGGFGDVKRCLLPTTLPIAPVTFVSIALLLN